MATATFTKSGTKATTPAKLDKNIFAVDVTNHELLKQAYLAHLANGRDAAAKTKKRGEVRGGGKKPWRQKGTGRARVGSSRSPIWRSGGIIFGPTGDQNYTHSLTTGAKRQAVRQALSLAASSNKIIVIEALDEKIAKTKQIATLLSKVGAKGTVLLVVDKKDESIALATRNLSDVKVTQSTYLNVFNVLNADFVVITSDSLKSISAWLTKEASKTVKPAAEVKS